jgi:membrane fusion protein (multidrug efflux system)
VKNDDTAMQMLIPSKAIVEQMGEYFVFIAKDTAMPVQDTAKGKKGDEKKGGDDNAKEKKNENNNAAGQPELHAFQRKVFLGQTIDSNVIVRYGLNDGETVITEGTQKLRDGARISSGKPPANGGQQGNNKNQ